MSFETEKLDKCIELIKSSSEKINSKIFLTGGGAEYYKKYIETNLKTEVIMMDEMDALVSEFVILFLVKILITIMKILIQNILNLWIKIKMH